MVHRRARLLCAIFLAAIALAFTSGCTPEQVQAFRSLTPAQQQEIVAAIQAQQRPRDCYSAIRQVFPASTWSWADSIVWRESRNTPTAANSRSSARGCWQLLSSVHADKYTKAGCHVSQWADPLCNTRAAYVLYKMAGTSPWRL